MINKFVVINKMDNNKLDCSKFVRYGKETPSEDEDGVINLKYLSGYEFTKGYINEATGYNSYNPVAIKIPEGYKKKRLTKDFIKEFYCDSSRVLLEKNNPIVKSVSHNKSYITHDNGGRPFLVDVGQESVTIWTSPYYLKESKSFVAEKDREAKWTYIEKIGSYKEPLKIFIGKSPRTPITLFSRGHGSKFDGNSILLKIGANRYVFIGESIYEFSTNDDSIEEFNSVVGNNDVPYPVSIGEKNIYFMLDKTFVPIDKFPRLTREIKNDAYSYYYGHSGQEELSKYAKKMKGVKIIQKRFW